MWRWKATPPNHWEHRAIQDDYLSGTNPVDFHVEYDDLRPISKRWPLMRVDMHNNATGDVWEIEPARVNEAAKGYWEAFRNAVYLNAFSSDLKGYYRGLAPQPRYGTPTGTQYNWTKHSGIWDS